MLEETKFNLTIVMFKRDQIMFNPQDESDEDMDVGDEVMAIRGRPSGMDEDEVDYDDDEAEGEVDGPTPKGRKEKPKKDVAKGRFGKAIPDSDDSESGSSGSESEEEEGWGRQYYAMPSARREKQKEDEYDERREEDRELEEREVRRLQRKARENLDADDFGLEDDEDEPAPVVEEESAPVLPPTSTDPAVLLRHMEVHEPIKLALTREWPLVVAKLEKTQRGMRKLEADKDANLHKGLGWLHYRELHTKRAKLMSRNPRHLRLDTGILHPSRRSTRCQSTRPLDPSHSRQAVRAEKGFGRFGRSRF